MVTKVKAPSPKDEPIKAPPVDNDHVEGGAEQFDDNHGVEETAETEEPERLSPSEEARVSAVMSIAKEQESPPEIPEVVVTAPTPPPPPRSIGARIRDVEKRWGKNFEHVMLDLHDHVFGTSKPHDESDDPLPKGD